jgi:CRP/FNR family cyclic AMP-dependent transcriptional regulator
MVVEIERLKTISYFLGFETSELESIKPYMIEKFAKKGEVILHEGVWSDYLFFLVSGLVKILKTSSNGKEQILHIAPPGASLNDVSTFDQGPNQAGIVAICPAQLYGIRKEDLYILLQSHPKMYLNIVKALAHKIRRDSNLVEELSSTQVIGRLAKLLLGTHASEESAAGLYLTQQDMASMIGTCREVVNRSLKIMEENGAIRLKRHRVIVTKKDILAEMAKTTIDPLPKYVHPKSQRKEATTDH